MTKRSRFLTHAALIAALYVALTYLQDLLIPTSASMPIQIRASEALCVLAFFTPAAIPGLTVGCFLFNVSYAHTLPLDFLLGTAATFFSVGGMYLTRRLSYKDYPFFGMLLPGIFNGLLVGLELSLYVGGAFWVNAVTVALGELIALLTLGSALFFSVKKRHLDDWLRSV